MRAYYVHYSIIDHNGHIADVYVLSSWHVERQPRQIKSGVWMIKRGMVSA